MKTIKPSSKWTRPRPGALAAEVITVRTVSSTGDTFQRVHISYVTDDGYEGTFYGLAESFMAQWSPSE